MASTPRDGRPTLRDIPLRTWLAVLGGFLALFSTVGFLNAYGVFQAYYQTHLLADRSPSAIAWIGSVSVFLLYLGSGLAGPLADGLGLGPRWLLFVGSVGMLVAVFSASLSRAYWQLVLTQGVLLGASMSIVFCSALAVAMRQMPHHRGLAAGLVMGGASIGGVVWPVVLQALLEHHDVGFAWSMRASGFVLVPILAVVCFTVVEPPSPPKKEDTCHPDHDKTSDAAVANDTYMSDPPAASATNMNTAVTLNRVRPDFDFSVLRNRTYILLCVGLAIAFLGWFIPMFYLSAYAIALGQFPSMAFHLVSLLNAASCLGRVVPGHLADTYGHYNLLAVSTILSGIIGFCWTKATTLAGVVVWTLAYGFFSGAVISLQTACAAKVTSHRSQGTAVGFLMACLSVSALIGAPISGHILRHSGYFTLSVCTGTTLVSGGLVVAAARFYENPTWKIAF
ncbi:major facilitator superfamily domain-containing protein [Podospora aff. communis PSN243]|uniref:Major facilitator superfamily domain-containing protein n=1 Tax=Podospora aff. communis PSN243 TaxID=3040156 RepID=A0AAV9G513_9PEZI|nr:major facilitator superfamily domain-containing protein [Podospora aff. communis PSN243]